jgi:hypothetical protein
MFHIASWAVVSSSVEAAALQEPFSTLPSSNAHRRVVYCPIQAEPKRRNDDGDSGWTALIIARTQVQSFGFTGPFGIIDVDTKALGYTLGLDFAGAVGRHVKILLPVRFIRFPAKLYEYSTFQTQKWQVQAGLGVDPDLPSNPLTAPRHPSLNGIQLASSHLTGAPVLRKC